MNPPTIHDANANGCVLVQRGIWGTVECPWRDVKPGETWQRGTLIAIRVPRPKPAGVRGAWN